MENDNTATNEQKKLNRRSIFDDPVDLFNFNQIQPVQSPSLSYAKMIQASRSVPGSRRNSNDDHTLDLLLGTKLSLNDNESGFRKLPSFAMTPQEPIGTFSQRQRSLDGLSKESDLSSFNPILSQANESPLGTLANAVPVVAISSAANTTPPSVNSTTDDYPELFTMTNINSVPTTSSLPAGSISSGISPENTNNTTSWIPYHQPIHNDAGQMMNPIMHSDIMQQHHAQMDTARRYSYGWHTPAANNNNAGNRMMTSQSTSDLANLKFAQQNGMYPIAENNSARDLSQIMCPQFQQLGFCSRHDVCPFAHFTPAAPSSPNAYFSPMAGIPPPPLPQTSLYQQYTMMTQQQKSGSFFNSPPPPFQQQQDHQQQQKPMMFKKYDHNQQQQQQQRRLLPDQDRFADAKIEDFVGKLYELCKDQNGCRFLQKKIEEKEEGDKNLEIVFKEIHSHFTELMTDPFGNYLCQKMQEKCNNEQRTVIVETVAPELVKIALNMHGTRAVQKLIEYLSTPQQIKTVTASLNANVVTLIKDLNGNHVIQKCLHRLTAENNQFIYDAVCANCIEVASHKHGCCVLQRCFDHATMPQKDQLVNEIARHALPLVQNPFGNYVVQYVLELGVTRYSESVIQRFVNHVCILSVQKFSSNVIENCIRTAQPPTRRLLIAELVNQSVMEKLLHDSFANYVVQTSLDFADEDQRAELVECIRPLLPTIRTTPYGKRIHSKIFRDSKSNSQFPQHRQRHRQYNDFGNLEQSHQQQQQNHHESSYQ